MNRLVLAAILVALVAPAVSGQTSAEVNGAGYCVAESSAAIPLLIGAGQIQYCVLIGTSGRIGDTTYIGGKISGPAPLLAAVTTISYFLVGCTAVGAPTARTNLAALNLAVVSFQPVTVTDTTCTGTVRFQVSIGGTAIIDQQFPFAFAVRDDVTAAMNFLCDNTGAAASAYSPTGTVCSQPTVGVEQVGDWIITDDANGWEVHQDAVSGELTICPELAPCHVSGDIGFSGNFTSNNTFPANLTVNAHFPGDEESPGFDRIGWLVFWIVLIAVFAYLGWWFALGGAIPGFLDAILPDMFNAFPDLTAELFLCICLLGFCLEAAASRFSWGYYKGRPRKGSVN